MIHFNKRYVICSGIYLFTTTLLLCTKPEPAVGTTDPVEKDPALFASYPFDGNADDASGNNHNATVSGATLTSDRFGHEKSAYFFNGKDNHIICSDMKSFPAGKTPRSVVGWFSSMVSAPSMAMLFGFGSTRDGYSFQVGIGPGSSGTQYRVNGWGGANDWTTGITAPAYLDGKWHHCAVTYDSVTTKIYFDGELKASTSKFSYIADPQTMTLVIGREIDLAGWEWNGALDDVAVYIDVLSAEEIKKLSSDK